MFIDPAAAPKEVREALKTQSPVDFEKTLQVARLWESLRKESLQELVAFQIQDLDPAAQEHVTTLINNTVDDLLNFIKEFTYAPNEEELDDAFTTFEGIFKDYARSVVSVRVAYAILKGVRVTETGVGTINEAFTQVNIIPSEDGGFQMQMSETATDEEKKTWRASWVVQAALECDFRNLAKEEKDYVNWVAGLEPEELTESALSTLENLLLKMQPNYFLFTQLGKEEMHKFQVRKIREAIKAVNDSDFKGLEIDEVQYIHTVEAMDDAHLTPREFANMSRFHAKVLLP